MDNFKRTIHGYDPEEVKAYLDEIISLVEKVVASNKEKNAPIEIIAEFEDWRKIKDWQRSEAWVHKNGLTGKRFVKIVSPGENNIYAKDDYKAKVIAKVEDEVVGEVKKCPVNSSFCLIKFGNIDGWLPRQHLYGIYPDEIID